MASESKKTETSGLLDPTASISSLPPIENESALEDTEQIKIYPQRWYILGLFTLLNATTNLLWNTWPPIQETCQLVFGWSKENILIIGAVQAIGSIISVLPCSWFIDTKGRGAEEMKNRFISTLLPHRQQVIHNGSKVQVQLGAFRVLDDSFKIIGLSFLSSIIFFHTINQAFHFPATLKHPLRLAPTLEHFTSFIHENLSGLRVAVLSSMTVQVVGVLCEVFPVHPFWARTFLVTFGEFLISIAAPAVQNVGILVLSATWFPPNERMTATAIATLVSYLGSATSYVMGPYMVPDVETGNVTYTAGHKIPIALLRNMTSDAQLKFLEGKINEYILAESIIVGILFFAVWIYFPAKPPRPPSVSSASARLDFLPGAKTLLKNRHFWLLLVIFSISNGINWGWSSVQDLIFSHVGISQKTAGWLGFSGNIASLLGIAFSCYADRIKRFTKPILIFLFICTALAQTVLSLACDQVIPLTTFVFYGAGIAQVVFYCGTVPLIMELAAECAYPVAEGITSGVLILSVYTINLFFFIGFMFPQTSPLWMNWLLAGSSTICIPLIAFYRGGYNRLDADLNQS